MELSADLRLRKTDKGQQELRERRFGLSARARQVLILIDGRRSCGDLARLLPAQDVFAFVALLEGDGFVERVPPGTEGASPAPPPATMVAPAAVSLPPTQLAAATSLPAASSLAAAPSLPAASSLAALDGLSAARARAVRALIDSTGPHGDAMAMRFERCRSAQELRELLPSAAAIVEAVAGREAARRFAERVGLG